jgi:hypothetical protein
MTKLPRLKNTHGKRVIWAHPPKRPGRGRVLVHNAVPWLGPELPKGPDGARRFITGGRGFRCWTQTHQKGLHRCRCSWTKLPHYRIPAFGLTPAQARTFLERVKRIRGEAWQ